MPKENAILTYWLCPAEPARTKLAGLIANLAARFRAPLFEPHVTIYVTRARHENAAAVVENVLTKYGPFQLAVRGLDHSEEFTKTLFVQFAPDPVLAQLSEDLRRASASPGDYELNPHLSLIYKEMDGETKRGLLASITLPFDEVFFDTVKAVISPAELTSRKQVEAWRIVAERKLAE